MNSKELKQINMAKIMCRCYFGGLVVTMTTLNIGSYIKLSFLRDNQDMSLSILQVQSLNSCDVWNHINLYIIIVVVLLSFIILIFFVLGN